VVVSRSSLPSSLTPRRHAQPSPPTATATSPPASAQHPGLKGRYRSAVLALGSNVRPGLWDPTLALRFAPAVTAEPYHTEASVSAPGQTLPPQSPLDCVNSPALPSPAITNHAGTAQDTPEVAEPEEQNASHNSGEEAGNEPEPKPLSYQIPEDKLSAAMCAAPKTRASYWSSNLYEGPDGEPLSLHYCKSKEVAERVARKFLKEKVLGFDIEWKPWGSPSSIKQNASLIQLACEDRIALFHIALFEGKTVKDLMPPSLTAILQSPDIYKVGVAIKGDVKRLEKYLRVQAQGVFELSRLHNLVQWHGVDPKQVNNKLVGLAAQVRQHLQLPLYKGEPLDDEPAHTTSVRESNWSLPLNLSQIHYAAADAYAGFRLYDTLERKRAQLKPKPPAVLLCDYDSAPRAKPPRKTTNKSTTSKAGDDKTTTLTVNVAKVEQDDEQESGGYETAPESFPSSQELNGPAFTSSLEPSNAAESSDRSAARRIGRIKLPVLSGPNPAHPSLPQESAPIQDKPSPIGAHQREQSISPTSVAPATNTGFHDAHRATNSDDPPREDDYADAGLEEALPSLTLDSSRRPRESLEEAPSLVPVPSPDPSHVKAGPGETEKSRRCESEVPSVGREQQSECHEVIIATSWARDYLQATIPSPDTTAPSRLRATIPHLRAYYLWHHRRFTVEKIARDLREPPLSLSTVQGYIVQAITMEKLEYNEETLRELILAMPVSQRRGRWSWLAKKLGALG